MEGDIDEPTFIEWPPGMKELDQIDEKTRKMNCICLRKTIYGNVDAALRFYNTYAQYLIDEIGMVRSKADACLFVWKDEAGRTKLVSSCHVDDTLLIGNKETIEQFKTSLKKRFKLKELGLMTRHLGFCINGPLMTKDNRLWRQQCMI